MTKQGYIRFPNMATTPQTSVYNMFDYRNFDEIFQFDPGFKYDSSAIETIEANRRSLEGLFIDKIFKLLDIKRRLCS